METSKFVIRENELIMARGKKIITFFHTAVVEPYGLTTDYLLK